MLVRTFRFIGSTAFLIAAAAGPATAQHWNPVTDWSASSNPGTVWSYGSSDTFGGFAALTDHATTCDGVNASVDCWYHHTSSTSNSAVIFHNSSTTTQFNGSFTIPDSVLVEGAHNANYAVVRWTAPTTGIFNVSGFFQQYMNGASFGETSGQYVLVNGVPVFTFNPTGQQFTQAFAFNLAALALTAGNTVDFVSQNLGHSVFTPNPTYGTFAADITQNGSPVTTTPEPGSLALLGPGLVGLVPILRRRGKA